MSPPGQAGYLFVVGLLILVTGAHGPDQEQAVPPVAETTPGSGLRPLGPAHVIGKALFFLYQHGASPSKGQRCPMIPSCSEYGRQAFEAHGVITGVVLAADRLHRCGHDLQFYPFLWSGGHFGRLDPVP